ncbi:hypothetical protein CS022_12930 [Veronia nyctiphanis]|uniref:Uncharacterized protein n=1 Tax=Veronia nyctiphanis TaxID=1278244 RepID=A0A4Q0YPR3_9GAMM|nr:hypothetical protein [Veronia nyctiphanis]RXJ72972.1 hypothetical protein CS022_12930 [Veronia nyctiphanis]
MTADSPMAMGETDELVLENDGLDLTAVAQQPMMDQGFDNQQAFPDQQQAFDPNAQQAFDPNMQQQGFDNMPMQDGFPAQDAMQQVEMPQMNMQQPDNSVAENLDMAMADPDLAMNPDLNVAASSDDAIGLEDMEKSLDEMAAPSEDAELSPDEALAAMWEQSLTEGDGDVEDIDALLDGAQGGDEPASVAEEPSAETNDALFDNVMEGEPEVDLTQDIDLSMDSEPEVAMSQDSSDALIDEMMGGTPEPEPEIPMSQDGSDALNDELMGAEPEPEIPMSQDGSDALIDELMDSGAEPEPAVPMSQDGSDALIDELMGGTPDPELETSLSDTDSDTLSAETHAQEDASDIGDTDALLDELLDNEHLDGNGLPLDLGSHDDAGDLSLPDSDLEVGGDALLDEMLDGSAENFDESDMLDQSIDASDLLTDVVDTVPDTDINVDLSDTDALLDELIDVESDPLDQPVDELDPMDELEALASSPVLDADDDAPDFSAQPVEEIAEFDMADGSMPDAVSDVTSEPSAGGDDVIPDDVVTPETSGIEALDAELDLPATDSVLDIDSLLDETSDNNEEAFVGDAASINEALSDEAFINEALTDVNDELEGPDNEANLSDELPVDNELSASSEFMPETSELAESADEAPVEMPELSAEPIAETEEPEDFTPDTAQEASADVGQEPSETEVPLEPELGSDSTLEPPQSEGQDPSSSEASFDAAMEENADFPDVAEPNDMAAFSSEPIEDAVIGSESYEHESIPEPAQQIESDLSTETGTLPESGLDTESVQLDPNSAVAQVQSNEAYASDAQVIDDLNDFIGDEQADSQSDMSTDIETSASEPSDIDLTQLPEYDEASALADINGEPAEIDSPQSASDEPLDLTELPEYSEEDAALDADLEVSPQAALDETQNPQPASDSLADVMPAIDMPMPADMSDSAVEAPELGSEDETADSLEDFSEPSTDSVADSPFNVPAEGLETLDDNQLGEFSEEDALHAAFEEQRELDGGFQEQTATTGQTAEVPVPETSVADMDDEQYQVAGLDMDALLSDPDLQDVEPPIPEDESAVWNTEQTPEPELESEDWSEQPQILGEDVTDLEFDNDLDSFLKKATVSCLKLPLKITLTSASKS